MSILEEIDFLQEARDSLARGRAGYGLNHGLKHSDLVDLAMGHMYRGFGCRIAIREPSCLSGERPDAIGWSRDGSIAIECKASVHDFRANFKKPWMRDGKGVGRRRYFLVPEGMLYDDEMSWLMTIHSETAVFTPEDWGLLLASKDGRIIADEDGCTSACKRSEYDIESEMELLVRLAAKGKNAQ